MSDIRQATADEMNHFYKLGLPLDADIKTVWLMKSNSMKNTGRLYWTWGHAFLFFDDQKFSIARSVAIGKISPEYKPAVANGTPVKRKSEAELDTEAAYKKRKVEVGELEGVEEELKKIKAAVERKRLLLAEIKKLKEEEKALDDTQEIPREDH